MPRPKKSTYIAIEMENDNKIYLTEFQVQIIKDVTLGIPTRSVRGPRRPGSSINHLSKKLRRYTEWQDLKFTQLCCRFAYKYGLVRL